MLIIWIKFEAAVFVVNSIQMEANTILKIYEEENQVAVARVLKNGCILEVKPPSFKMFLKMEEWSRTHQHTHGGVIPRIIFVDPPKKTCA
jgi:hypothetical protein